MDLSDEKTKLMAYYWGKSVEAPVDEIISLKHEISLLRGMIDGCVEQGPAYWVLKLDKENQRLCDEINILKARDSDAEVIIADMRKQIARFDGVPSDYCLNVLISECHCNLSSCVRGGYAGDEWKNAIDWMIKVAGGGEQ